MIRVAILGSGFMGQTHLGCFARSSLARVVAVGGRSADELRSGARVEGNIASNESPLDLNGVRLTTEVESLIFDPEIELVSCCLPTPQHAQWTIAALEAGKHVLCEKPMALSVEECDAVLRAQHRSGKTLMIGHCLRFWPHYVRAHQIIQSGQLGEILWARFFRAGGAPTWSRWMMDGAQSGGAVLDLHLHDIDIALWWFGKPAQVRAAGVLHNGLPIGVDATWSYPDGPHVQLSGSWNPHGGAFKMGFELVGRRGALSWDSSRGEALQLLDKSGESPLEVSGESAYQLQIDYLLDCIATGKSPARVAPESSRAAVEIAVEELRQIGFG